MKGQLNMKKRLVSLLLVVMMLFGMVSCQALESFIGYENLDQEYLDKYYPGMYPGTGSNGGSNTGDSGNDGPTEQVPNTH